MYKCAVFFFLMVPCGGVSTMEKLLPSDPKFIKKMNESLGFPGYHEDLFAWLGHVEPQPAEAFVRFSNEKLASGFLEDSASWMKVFLQPDLNPYVKKVKPSKFFLGSGRTTDLLVYEFKHNKLNVQIQESTAALLLSLTPIPSLANDKGISGEDLAKVLEMAVNLKHAAKGKNTIDVFRLPLRLAPGSVFSNSPKIDSATVVSADWSDCIIGFVTSKGIGVLFFKRSAGQMLAGFTYDPEWLRKYLYEEDGKTPVIERRRKKSEK